LKFSVGLRGGGLGTVLFGLRQEPGREEAAEREDAERQESVLEAAGDLKEANALLVERD